ncbi:glucosamine-6-phosphate deaminase [Bacillaceae bacterium S4-13-56]
MKLIVLDSKHFDSKAAEIAYQHLKRKQEISLGFATGNTTIRFHKALAKKIEENKLDVSKINTFILDEYIGLPKNHPNSCYYRMNEQLFKSIHLQPKQIHFFNNVQANEDLHISCDQYEKSIESCGGIDIQFLGIGLNGHIGFNEPGTPFESTTHVINIDENSRLSKAYMFESFELVPTKAITMGIKSIMMAKQIFLLAKGNSKADIIKQALCGPITTDIPASILQLHPFLTVIIDTLAAEKIDKTE